MRKNYYGWVMFFILGALAGWILSKNTGNLGITASPVRQGGYEFINPLLECEGGDLSRELRPFKKNVEKLVNEKTSRGSADFISVYFRDLNNGPWFGINERENFSPASLLKVTFMMAALKQAERNPEFLNQQVIFNGSQSNQTQYFKGSSQLTPGATYSMSELVYRMIVYSDNDAKDTLLANIEPAILKNIYADLGVVEPEVGKTDNFMNIKNYASFFRILYNASYLNREMSNEALRVLNDVEFKKGIVAGVPNGIKVAHKFGEREYLGKDQLHDCGIVYYPDHPYLLCVMTRGNDFEAMVQDITAISKLVYEEVFRQRK